MEYCPAEQRAWYCIQRFSIQSYVGDPITIIDKKVFSNTLKKAAHHKQKNATTYTLSSTKERMAGDGFIARNRAFCESFTSLSTKTSVKHE